MLKLVKRQKGGIADLLDPKIKPSGVKLTDKEMATGKKEQAWVDNWYKNRVTYPTPIFASPTTLTLPKDKPKLLKADLQGALGKNILGFYEPMFNQDKIYLDNDFSSPKFKDDETILHEYNHYIQNYNEEYAGYEDKVDNPIKAVGLNKTFKGDPNYDYMIEPREVHSRLMQYRYRNNLKPTQRIDSIDKNWKAPEGTGDFFTKMTEQQLKDLLNKTVSNKLTSVNTAKRGGLIRRK